MSSVNPDEKPAENPEVGATTAEPASAAPPPAEDEEVMDINLGCLRQIEVEIPADVVAKQWDSAVERLKKVARVPGFRKGKAPASVVRQRYADDIKKEMLQALLPEHIGQAIAKEGYKPIADPELVDLQMEEGKPLRAKAVFEVLPDIELGNYQDIKIDVPEIAVSDQDVETELKQLQERQSSYDPVEEDRPLLEGDFAQISFQAREAGTEAAAPETTEKAATPEASASREEASQPAHMDEVLVEIGGANTMAEFSENLRGAKTGEERTFDVTYPAEYYEPRLAGKTMSYTAKVNGIKKKTRPELTDDFAKELDQEIQTLDDLKKRLRDGIYADRRNRALTESREKLLTQLTDSHQFPVPEILIHRQIDFRLEQWLRSLAAQGMRTEDMKRMDFKKLRASQREAATREVKATLLLGRIAQAENIQVSDEEVDQEIQALAQQSQQTPEAVRQKLLEAGRIESIRNRMRTDKALQFLYNQSTSHARNGAAQE